MSVVTIAFENTNLLDSTKQSAELYSYSDTDLLATVTFKGCEVAVIVAGEMRIVYDGGVIRRTDELADLGITNDAELAAFLEREDVEMVNNPWFEVYDLIDPDHGEVCHDAVGALDYAVRLAEREDN